MVPVNRPKAAMRVLMFQVYVEKPDATHPRIGYLIHSMIEDEGIQQPYLDHLLSRFLPFIGAEWHVQ